MTQVLMKSEGQVYSNFIDTLKTAKTKKNYLNCLKQYMRFLGTDSYVSLLEGATSDISENIKSWVLDRRGKISSGGIDVHLYALQHFYEMNDIENISWKKLKRFKGEETATHDDRAYTHEEIQQLLNIADVRLTPVVLLLSGSGLRIGALPDLRLKHLTKKDRGPMGLYKVDVYSGYKEHYYTFTTPECATAIDTYIQFRERYGEIISPESPLFRKQFNIEDITDTRDNVAPLSLAAIEKDICKHLERVGLRSINHEVDGFKTRKVTKLSHGYRKFFTNQCLKSGIMREFRMLLEGHELEGNDPNYVRVTEDQLFSEYSKAINNLTINPENRLKIEVQLLKKEQSEIDLMKLEMKRAKEDMESLVELRLKEYHRKSAIDSLKDLLPYQNDPEHLKTVEDKIKELEENPIQ